MIWNRIISTKSLSLIFLDFECEIIIADDYDYDDDYNANDYFRLDLLDYEITKVTPSIIMTDFS